MSYRNEDDALELYYWELEKEKDPPMSIAEYDRAEAEYGGADYPERAWLLSSRDVWYPNPHYNGPPVPHPEYDDDY